MDDSDFAIDELALDREWLRQPSLYFRYARKAADAKLAWGAAKVELEITRADLSKMIRSNPESFGIAKPTEKAVEDTIPRQQEYTDAVRAVAQRRYEMDIIDAAIGAIDHRKKALENLVSLHLAGYFSEPRPRDEETRDRMEHAGKTYARARGLKNDD